MKAIKRLVMDKHVFAVFRIRERIYNTLIVLFHDSIVSYQLWRESIVDEIGRFHSDSTYIPNQFILKYDPPAPLAYLQDDIKRVGEIELNGTIIDSLTFQLMVALARGNGIKVNENLLSKELGMHRHTIKRRIQQLLKRNIIQGPICRFWNVFTLPNLILTLEFLEIKKENENFIEEIKADPHVSVAYKMSEGRYNFFFVGTFKTLEGHVAWEERYRNKYGNLIGSSRVIHVPNKLIISIDNERVVAGAIDDLIRETKILSK